jgi:ketosteroid isomerase-like protein
VITSHLIPILIGLAILIGAGWYFLFPSPARVAVKYIEASGKGDAKTALSLMTTQSQELIPANDPSATQTIMPKMADKIEAKVTETKITGDTATCTLSISLPGQDSSNNQVAGMTQTVPLRKEGGKWKIDFRQTMVDIFRAMNQFKPGSLSTVKAQIAAKVGNDQKLLNAWNSVLQEASSQ